MADGLNFVPFSPGPGLAEQITAHVERQIVQGILKSEQRVQESKIVAELGVSRGMVREAFRILERRRLLCLVPRRGAVVAALSPSRVADLAAILHLLIEAGLTEVVPAWSSQTQQTLDQSLIASKERFGAISPVCVFRTVCRLHSNRALAECYDDFSPTFDRLFAKLIRIDPAKTKSLVTRLEQELLPAFANRALEDSLKISRLLTRDLERKYLETLERTG